MILKTLKLILALLIFVTLPILILGLTPIYIIRYIVAKTARLYRPDLGKILTTKSTCVGVDDINGNPQWTLLLAFVIKGRPKFDGFKKRFMEKVLEAKNEAGELNKPELQQYVTSHLGFLFWKWDTDFQVENHIHQNPGNVKFDKLNEESLFRIGQSLIYKPYPEGRSPWELIFLPNYQMETEDGEPCSVILLRAHHVLADGFSLLKLFVMDFCQSENLNVAEPSHIPGTPKPEAKVVSKIQKYFGPAYMLLRGPYDLASAIIDVLRFNSNQWHVPEKQLTRTINSAFSTAINIQAVKDVKNLYNCSFASVLLTAYTGALRKFMAEAGYKVPRNILCAIALPIPGHPDKLRNHATGVLVRLPTGQDSPTERIQAVNKNQLELRTSTLPITIFFAMTFVGGLFAWMTRLMTKNTVTTAVGSIFPGPNKAMSGAGFTALQVTYAGGLTRGNTGLGFSCLSYNGKMIIIAGVDEGIVPASKLPAQKLLNYMIEELQMLKKEALARQYDIEDV